MLAPDVQASSRDEVAGSLSPVLEGGIDVAEPIVLETALIDEKIRESYISVVDPDRNRVVTVIEDTEPG